MDIQQVMALKGQRVQIWPCIMSRRSGTLVDVLPNAGPRGEDLFVLDCGNLRFRLLDWRIFSMVDQVFDEDVPTNDDGSVDLVAPDSEQEEEKRPTAYAGNKKTRRAKEAAAKPKKETPVAKAAPAERTVNTCRCGCGGNTYSLFVPGHDARVKSQLLKVARGQLAQSEVNQSVWDLVESNEKWSQLWADVQQKAKVEAELAAQEAAKQPSEEQGGDRS